MSEANNSRSEAENRSSSEMNQSVLRFKRDKRQQGGPSAKRLAERMAKAVLKADFSYTFYSATFTVPAADSSTPQVLIERMRCFFRDLIHRTASGAAVLVLNRRPIGGSWHLHGLVAVRMPSGKVVLPGKIEKWWCRAVAGKSGYKRPSKKAQKLRIANGYNAIQRTLEHAFLRRTTCKLPSLENRVFACGGFEKIWRETANQLHLPGVQSPASSVPLTKENDTPASPPKSIRRRIKERRICGWCLKDLLPRRSNLRWHKSCRRRASDALKRKESVLGQSGMEWVKRLERRGLPRRDAILEAEECVWAGFEPILRSNRIEQFSWRRKCRVCGEWLADKPLSAKTCSQKCRQKYHRRRSNQCDSLVVGRLHSCEEASE